MNSFEDNNEESRLKSLREWYGRRSKQYESNKYTHYHDSNKISSSQLEDYSELENKLEFERETSRRKFNERLTTLPTSQPLSGKQESYSKDDLLKVLIARAYVEQTILGPKDFLIHEEGAEASSAAPHKPEDNNTTSKEVIERPCPESSFQQKILLPKKMDHIEEKEIDGNNRTSLSPLSSNEQLKPASDLKGSEAGKKNTSKFSTWLENYSSSLEALRKEIDNFERDEARKGIRVQISRTLAGRINDCAKRNCTKQELATLGNFLEDLFDGKLVTGWNGEEFRLDRGDSSQCLYAMAAICERYFEQVKWDAELMDQVLLVLLMLCLRQQLFYNVFCAKLVGTLLLLSFDPDKIMAKIDSFGSETGEAVSHWIANEQAIFRLFGKIQLALKFGGDTKSTSGAELLKAIFVKALEAHKSVPLCSSFALEEILNHFSKQLMADKSDPEFAKQMNGLYIPFIRSNVLKDEGNPPPGGGRELGISAKMILISRQKFLNGLLKDALDR